MHISDCSNLTVMYSIILSLAITSCTAKQTVSRLKMLKDQLHCSMGDLWLSKLLILVLEKDVFKAITNAIFQCKYQERTTKISLQTCKNCNILLICISISK